MKKKRIGIAKGITVLALTLVLTGCSVSDKPASTESQSRTEDASQSTAAASESTVPVTDEQPQINVKEIWQKYDQDPDKHTPVYDGSSETATGVITYIGKDDHGTDSMQLSDTKDGTSYVLGVFGSADEMAEVSVGDTVTITGNFHIMSSTNMVVLKQCRILDVYE